MYPHLLENNCRQDCEPLKGDWQAGDPTEVESANTPGKRFARHRKMQIRHAPQQYGQGNVSF